MPLIRATTMATTWSVQIEHPDGEWYFDSQAEWDDDREADQAATRMYGGQATTRLVRIDRTALPETVRRGNTDT